MHFANYILKKLAERNLKPSQLAHYSGVSAGEISRLLAGHRMPSLKTIRKLSAGLKVSEEEMIVAAGYVQQFTPPKTTTVPIAGECPAHTFDFSIKSIIGAIEINWDFVQDKKAFAIKVKGDCLKNFGIFNGDYSIVSPQTPVNDGDLVVIRGANNECAIRRFHKAEPYAILMSCDARNPPIVLDSKTSRDQIVGKVIRAIRNL